MLHGGREYEQTTKTYGERRTDRRIVANEEVQVKSITREIIDSQERLRD